jgi:hypothetical protein
VEEGMVKWPETHQRCNLYTTFLLGVYERAPLDAFQHPRCLHQGFSGLVPFQSIYINQKTFWAKLRKLLWTFRQTIFHRAKYTITVHYHSIISSHLFGVDLPNNVIIFGRPDNYLFLA